MKNRSMENFFRTYYGYGSARIAIPTQCTGLIPRKRWPWLYHPSFIGLLLTVLLVWMLQDYHSTIIQPARTILWVQQTPNTVVPKKLQKPRRIETAPQPVAIQPQKEKKKTPPLSTQKTISAAPRQLVIEKKESISRTDAPLLPIGKQQTTSARRKPVPQRKTVAPPPPQAIASLSSRHSAKSSFFKIKELSSKSTPAPSPVPETINPSSREKSTTGKIPGKNGLYNFQPLPPAKQPRLANLPGKKLSLNNRTLLFSGKNTVNIPEGDAIVPVKAAAKNRKKHFTTAVATEGKDVPLNRGEAIPSPSLLKPQEEDKRHAHSSAWQPSTPFIPAGPKPKFRPLTENFLSKKDADENVKIIGRVLGESIRVENLKRIIYEKALILDREKGPYCCSVQNIKCKLTFIGKDKISLSFSQNRIAFDILSKLERRLPEGMQSCAY